MKKFILFAIIGVMMSASSAFAVETGQYSGFWTDVSSATIRTAINATNLTGGTVTITAVFYGNQGVAAGPLSGVLIGSTTRSVGVNARWAFETTDTGNTVLDTDLATWDLGTVRVFSTGNAIGAYSTVYKTSKFAGFSFTIQDGTAGQ